MSQPAQAWALRQTALGAGQDPVPRQLQGVSKDRIIRVLTRLAIGTTDMIDAVYALLDDRLPSWFARGAAKGLRFCDGATTAQVACHVGILQRGVGQLDREGRDYWIKPLRQHGAVVPVYLSAETGGFIAGHPIPKSPNSAYRLHPAFREILQAPEERWVAQLDAWVAEDANRERQALQGAAEERARTQVTTGHSSLIIECQRVFAPRFLPGYELLYTDIGDGDRVTQDARGRLRSAGLELNLGDAMPDLLLWNRDTDALWVMEAVTSDGEVDWHKKQRLTAWASQYGKANIGFTTAFWSWKAAAARQGRLKNIEADTWLWIAEDPGKHWRADSTPVRC